MTESQYDRFSARQQVMIQLTRKTRQNLGIIDQCNLQNFLDKWIISNKFDFTENTLCKNIHDQNTGHFYQSRVRLFPAIFT